MLSQFTGGGREDGAFIPTSSFFTMIFPISHALPTPEMATASTMATHLITPWASLNLFLAFRTRFSVSQNPVHVFTLRTVFVFPIYWHTTRDRSMWVFKTLSAGGGSTLAFDRLFLVKVGELVADIITAFSTPHNVLVLFCERFTSPSPVDIHCFFLSSASAKSHEFVSKTL